MSARARPTHHLHTHLAQRVKRRGGTVIAQDPRSCESPVMPQSAITAGLARGLALPEAVGEAKLFLANAVAHFLRWTRDGHTTDALHHFAPRQ